MSSKNLEPEHLLATLDAAVRCGGALSGLQGRVAFGIASATTTTWWSAAFFHDRVETTIACGEAPYAHASIIMGDADARALLARQGAGDHERFSVRGDKKLVARFMDRYLRNKSQLALRVSLNQR